MKLATGMSVVKRSKGFTLLEVMIVIVILAIVTTVAVVYFSGFTRRRQLQSAGQNLKTLVESMKTEALLKPAILGLRFKPHGFDVMRFYQDSQTGRWRVVNNSLLNSLAVGHDINLKLISLHGVKHPVVSSDAPQIVFSTNAEVTSFTLQIGLSGLKNSLTMVVDAGGDVMLLPTQLAELLHKQNSKALKNTLKKLVNSGASKLSENNASLQALIAQYEKAHA